MSDELRSIGLEIEVPGRPDEVWWAVATGPGISSWYVPHTVEERAGGVGTASFGPEPEMQVSGRVAVWEPPRRILFDGGEGVDGLSFEWTIEPRGDAACMVRLVNSGFGSGPEHDALREGMIEGWRLFMLNLRLHREHFAGRVATAVIPMALWAGPREAAWRALLGGLGLPPDPAVGDRIEVAAADAPELAGTVVDVDPRWIALVLDHPAPGTAFLAVEGDGEAVTVSIWSYLYGSEGASAAARDDPCWRQWLTSRAAGPGC
ncbi:MAG: SRPBCC domain-containing protein [bacterium]|nr:SRPBCC domain-containing protein [bacterium]